jgi:hypothetical protein
MLQTLNGYSITGRIETENDNEWIVELHKDRKYAYAFWALDDTPLEIDMGHSMTIPTRGSGSGTIVSLYGESSGISIPASGELPVTAGESPSYLLLHDDVSIRPGSLDIGSSLNEITLSQAGGCVLFSGFSQHDHGSMIQIYDLQGQLIDQLPVYGKTVVWDGLDAEHTAVPAGLYFAKVSNSKNSNTFTIIIPD